VGQMPGAGAGNRGESSERRVTTLPAR
jgi:hypothetical protein